MKGHRDVICGSPARMEFPLGRGLVQLTDTPVFSRSLVWWTVITPSGC